jgi:ABC-type antimicrobial peptide transport system permease subunit
LVLVFGFWVVFSVCLFVLFFVFFPFDEDNDQTTSETLSPGWEAEGLTPKL